MTLYYYLWKVFHNGDTVTNRKVRIQLHMIYTLGNFPIGVLLAQCDQAFTDLQ